MSFHKIKELNKVIGIGRDGMQRITLLELEISQKGI
jgi:hypothetical protein